MRILMKQDHEQKRPDGGTDFYCGGAVFPVDDKLGQRFIKLGIASEVKEDKPAAKPAAKKADKKIPKKGLEKTFEPKAEKKENSVMPHTNPSHR